MNNFGNAAKNFNDTLKETLINSKELSKNFGSTEQMLKKVGRNQKAFNDLQKEIMGKQYKTIGGYWQKVHQEIQGQLELLKKVGVEQYRIDAIESMLTKQAFENQEKKAEVLKNQLDIIKQQANFSGKMGSQVKKMLADMSQEKGIGKKFGVVKDFFEGRGMKGGAKAAVGVAVFATIQAGLDKIVSGLDKLKKGLDGMAGFTISLNPLILGFQLLFAGVKSLWEYMDKKIMPMIAHSNKAFGDMEHNLQFVNNQATAMGLRFERMGYSFAEGAEAVIDFNAALKSMPDLEGKSKKQIALIREQTKETAQLGIKLTKYVGLSAEAAGALAISFDRSSVGQDGLNDSMAKAEIIAKRYGVPINQIRKDMGENINIVQRFGTTNRIQFLKASALARVYGLDIQKVNDIFGNQMNSFEKATDIAGNMNAIFGTQINSWKLLTVSQGDATKRMVMLGKEMLKQGKDWDSLTWSQKDFVAQQLQTDESTASLILSKKNLTKSTEDMEKAVNKELKSKKAVENADKRWNNSISALKMNLLDLKVQVAQVFKTIGDKFFEVVNKFTGGKTTITSIANDIEGSFTSVKSAIEGIDAQAIADSIKDIVKGIKDLIGTAQEARDAFDDMLDPVKARASQQMVEKIQGGFFNKDTASEIMRAMNKDAKLADMVQRKMKLGGMSNQKFKAQMDYIKSVSEGTLGQPKEEKEINLLEKVKKAEIKKPKSKGDALITKKGQIIDFDPSDNIMATKKDIGINKKENNMKAQNQPQQIVIHNHVYLDGKQISESIVRQSRY